MITPSSISLGSVLVGATPSSVSGTLTNAGSIGSGTYTTYATGSATVSPGSGTLSPGAAQVIIVGATSVGAQSGNNISIGTVGASNSANVSGSAVAAVTANVFQTASLTTGRRRPGTTLNLTNGHSTDGGQRAGVTIASYTTTNSNFLVTTVNSGTVGTANGSNVTSTVGTVGVASNLLSGTYNYTGTVTGSAQYTDTALAAQGTVTSPVWSGVSVSGTVASATSSGTGQVRQAFVSSGSSYAGYGLTSAVPGGIGQGTNPTVAKLLAGNASGDTTVQMNFSSTGTNGGGEAGNAFASGDILSLSGLHGRAGGTSGPDGSFLTDTFVLQMSYVPNVHNINNIYYIGWYDPAIGIWVNAIAGNSNANLPADYIGSGPFAGTYAQSLATAPGATPSAGGNGLTLDQQLGAYGYVYNSGDPTQDIVWAVLDHNSDFESIPEPGTYAMIFSGFGMLIGFRRLRRRSPRQ